MRAKNTPVTRKRRKKTLKKAEGYFGSKHKLFKTAKEQLMNSYKYAYRDRRNKKRDFRKIWILKINNACRVNNLTYSKFIRMLKLAHIKMNRKSLAELSINEPNIFSKLILNVKENYSNIKEFPKSVI
ncbi:MAG TPA: 50S ribosomal protein L20 [Mycoplasmatales bacterium]|nr:50S ribosomal protein L20 [Mycoplasmatales bacterium]